MCTAYFFKGFLLSAKRINKIDDDNFVLQFPNQGNSLLYQRNYYGSAVEHLVICHSGNENPPRIAFKHFCDLIDLPFSIGQFWGFLDSMNDEDIMLFNNSYEERKGAYKPTYIQALRNAPANSPNSPNLRKNE